MRLNTLVKDSCGGGDCPAVHLDEDSGIVLVQGDKLTRRQRRQARRQVGLGRGETYIALDPAKAPASLRAILSSQDG